MEGSGSRTSQAQVVAGLRGLVGVVGMVGSVGVRDRVKGMGEGEPAVERQRHPLHCACTCTAPAGFDDAGQPPTNRLWALGQPPLPHKHSSSQRLSSILSSTLPFFPIPPSPTNQTPRPPPVPCHASPSTRSTPPRHSSSLSFLPPSSGSVTLGLTSTSPCSDCSCCPCPGGRPPRCAVSC